LLYFKSWLCRQKVDKRGIRDKLRKKYIDRIFRNEEEMGYYTVCLKLQDAPCLVVGGGQVGERKIKTLLTCGARVSVISRDLTPELQAAVDQGEVEWLARDYETRFMEKKRLVIGATDDQVLNERLHEEARERGILCNIVDNPPLGDFILPSIVRRGDLSIAVSTSGKSPALAKKIREGLEHEFPGIYSAYVDLLGVVRSQILARGLAQRENQTLFETLINAPLLTWLEKGEAESFYAFMDSLLNPPISRSQLSASMGHLFNGNRNEE
jgi:precorrin-2 dehydrogenase / sirohydrochlorin ferrochelatase